MAPISVTARPKNEGAAVTAATSKNLPYLDHLAAELQIEIAKNLDKEDLRAMRRVSRSLAENTFDVFAEKNFTNLSCRFTTRSLKITRDISATPQFARRVKKMEVCAGYGYKTELERLAFVPEFVFEGRASQLHELEDVRTQKTNDALLKDIFSNFARCGTAKCVRLSVTEDVFLPAMHTLAIAANTSGHIVEELHCSIRKLPTRALEVSAEYDVRSWEHTLETAFPEVAKHSWSNLRAIHFKYPRPGNFMLYVRSALCKLIRAACSVQELAFQAAFGHYYFWEGVRYALTERHNLKVLRILGDKVEELHFIDHRELRAILSQVNHSLETLVLEDIIVASDADDYWKETLDWLSNALSLRYLSCQNLRNTSSVLAPSWLLLDGKGNSHFEVEGSKEEVKEKLSTLVAEAGRCQELEIDCEA
ncbi:hypothetical protein CB0940_06499 [Cercospora beticola]|uniref:F-box domain-containing protein n=1 Tax=Cercospora beticola TaxID=122368 RepID=A0A2G5HX48_CERBT|nr:hypothetical protein CB0940_06499 [Cercospora beticola]PIA97116.1 hypothetical protein CB0940_06499 [Cercospora beticola]WPA99137.1 hypothetical protein RHO25_003753 [Cercospora beticola]